MNYTDILKTKQHWAVIGVSAKEDKYGYKVYAKLKELGKTVYGVSPVYKEIDGDPTYENLAAVHQPIDVVVFIVNKKFGKSYVDEMAKLHLHLAWMQPGTYDDELLAYMKEREITPILDCVLVQSENL